MNVRSVANPWMDRSPRPAAVAREVPTPVPTDLVTLHTRAAAGRAAVNAQAQQTAAQVRRLCMGMLLAGSLLGGPIIYAATHGATAATTAPPRHAVAEAQAAAAARSASADARAHAEKKSATAPTASAPGEGATGATASPKAGAPLPSQSTSTSNQSVPDLLRPLPSPPNALNDPTHYLIPGLTLPTPPPRPPTHYTAKGTGYYPAHTRREGGKHDMMGRPLHTLQDFLAGRAKYVSVAMDTEAGFDYGARLRIPELERRYGRSIEFRVVDTGGDFVGTGTSRIDICTRNLEASHEPTINGQLTLIPVKP